MAQRQDELGRAIRLNYGFGSPSRDLVKLFLAVNTTHDFRSSCSNWIGLMRFRMWHAGLLALLLFAAAGSQADEVDYTRDIKPVLKAKCFSCHASIEQEADLRLDTVAAMVAGGDSGATLIPGDSAGSLLLQRVAANDPLDRMPPDGEPMSPDQIARLRQ